MVLELFKGILFGGGIFACAVALVALALYLAVLIVFHTENVINKIREKLS